jgi:phosphorylcholine metabolism protein LicD
MIIVPTLTEKNLLGARKILFDVVAFLKNEQIDHRLEEGTLLGQVRDKELLPWDHDMDLSMSLNDSRKFAKKRRMYE